MGVSRFRQSFFVHHFLNMLGMARLAGWGRSFTGVVVIE